MHTPYHHLHHHHGWAIYPLALLLSPFILASLVGVGIGRVLGKAAARRDARLHTTH